MLGRAHHTIPSLVQACLDKMAGQIKFLKDQTKVLMGKNGTAPPVPSIKAEKHWKSLQMRVQVS